MKKIKTKKIKPFDIYNAIRLILSTIFSLLLSLTASPMLLSLTTTSNTAPPELTAQNSKYEKEIIVNSGQCLEYKGMSGRSINSYSLRFYNKCSSGLYANVCIEERPGKFRLYSRRIPDGGFWTINNYAGSAPLSLDYNSSGTANPPVPKACANQNQKN